MRNPGRAGASFPRAAVAAHAKEQFTAPPDRGYNVSLAITRDGGVTVTNSRNGFSKTYQVK